MSVEKLIAGITRRSNSERAVMREHALAGLKSDNAMKAADAARLLEALEDFVADEAVVQEQFVRSVANEPLTKRVVVAFQTDKPSLSEERLIQVLLDHPGSTCAELSSQIGWARNTWDMGFGALCGKRSHFLRALAGTSSEGASSNLPLLTLQSRGPDGAIRYTMKPEAAEAFRQLGYGSN